jgi:hypothetical protein
MPDLRLPEFIEAYRDQAWNRDPELRLELVTDAEAFIEKVGFCAALTDSRRPGPSLFIAVCGRRDAHLPKNVQKDPEMNLAWTIKDELLRRGRVYYGRLSGNRTMFVSRRLLAQFNNVFGIERKEEHRRLSSSAQRVLKTLRTEWELSTGELRIASGIRERPVFTKALDELQRALKVIPMEVVYAPKFTYIWGLTEARFRDELKTTISRQVALRDIAHNYLQGAGMTLRGDLARVTGISNPDAGQGNWALVDEGFANRLAPGVYSLAELKCSLTD